MSKMDDEVWFSQLLSKDKEELATLCSWRYPSFEFELDMNRNIEKYEKGIFSLITSSVSEISHLRIKLRYVEFDLAMDLHIKKLDLISNCYLYNRSNHSLSIDVLDVVGGFTLPSTPPILKEWIDKKIAGMLWNKCEIRTRSYHQEGVSLPPGSILIPRIV